MNINKLKQVSVIALFGGLLVACSQQQNQQQSNLDAPEVVAKKDTATPPKEVPGFSASLTGWGYEQLFNFGEHVIFNEVFKKHVQANPPQDQMQFEQIENQLSQISEQLTNIQNQLTQFQDEIDVFVEDQNQVQVNKTISNISSLYAALANKHVDFTHGDTLVQQLTNNPQLLKDVIAYLNNNNTIVDLQNQLDDVIGFDSNSMTIEPSLFVTGFTTFANQINTQQYKPWVQNLVWLYTYYSSYYAAQIGVASDQLRSIEYVAGIAWVLAANNNPELQTNYKLPTFVLGSETSQNSTNVIQNINAVYSLSSSNGKSILGSSGLTSTLVNNIKKVNSLLPSEVVKQPQGSWRKTCNVLSLDFIESQTIPPTQDLSGWAGQNGYVSHPDANSGVAFATSCEYGQTYQDLNVIYPNKNYGASIVDINGVLYPTGNDLKYLIANTQDWFYKNPPPDDHHLDLDIHDVIAVDFPANNGVFQWGQLYTIPNTVNSTVQKMTVPMNHSQLQNANVYYGNSLFLGLVPYNGAKPNGPVGSFLFNEYNMKQNGSNVAIYQMGCLGDDMYCWRYTTNCAWLTLGNTQSYQICNSATDFNISPAASFPAPAASIHEKAKVKNTQK